MPAAKPLQKLSQASELFARARELFVESASQIKQGTMLLCDVGDILTAAKDKVPLQWAEWLAKNAPEITEDQAAACMRYAAKRRDGLPTATICRQAMLDFGVTPPLESTTRNREERQPSLASWAGNRAATLLDQATTHLTEALRAKPLGEWTEVERREWIKRTDPILEFREQLENDALARTAAGESQYERGSDL